MQIQNNCNVNFEAKRVLNVRRAVQGGADEIVDVFLLGKEDEKFMKRCYHTLKNSERNISENYSLNRRFKEFFSAFLNNDGAGSMVAIKNGEILAGVAKPECGYEIIMPRESKQSQTSLLFAAIEKAKEGIKKGIGGLDVLSMGKLNYDAPVSLLECNSLRYCYDLQNRLKLQNQTYTFDKVKDKHEYDLEEFLGIKDIETEIM